MRKKNFRKLQRGGKGKNKVKNVSIASGNLKMLHSNLRGFLSKKTSLVYNVKCTNPDIICLNGLRGKNKVIIAGYFTFCKNRVDQAMGGVSVSLDNCMKQQTV